MPRVTKNNAVLKGILQVPSNTALPTNNYQQQLEQLAVSGVEEFSAKVAEVSSLLAKLQSLEAGLLVKLLRIALHSATESNISSVGQVLMSLAGHKFDEDQVTTELKRTKEIDAVFALALLWKFHHDCKAPSLTGQFARLLCILKLIRLLLVSYPVDLMVSGGPYVAKWRNLILQEAQILQMKRMVSGMACWETREGKVQVHNNKFIDIVIPL